MPSWESRTSWYGPAHIAVTYVLIRGARWKCTVVAGPAGSVRSTGMFEMTRQWLGAVTCQVNSALRSGWSKQAYTRWASAVSNWL